MTLHGTREKPYIVNVTCRVSQGVIFALHESTQFHEILGKIPSLQFHGAHTYVHIYTQEVIGDKWTVA